MSSVSASCVLILTLINPALTFFGDAELNIMAIGIGFGVVGLLVGQAIDKYFPVSKVEKQI
jgi:SSS family solute:Na+ symporter